jgi:phosphoribosyl 1,2-cyclic phosphate phosphodiesterase
MTDFALFIGTGSSLGVPVIGCPCERCHSLDPKNKRFRSSLYLNIGGKAVLIDAGPDLRAQALRFSIDQLDGVIFTHAHQDHTGGVDDLRIYHYRNKGPLPCLVSMPTAEDLKRRFYFMFKEQLFEPVKSNRLELNILEERSGNINFLGIPLRYFSYEQVGMQVMGLRIGSFAYVTDIKQYSSDVFKELEGVKTLVLSALKFTPSPMHFTVDEAVEFIEKIKPERAYLTHIAHELDHEKTNALLPSFIQLAYDGLKIELP